MRIEGLRDIVALEMWCVSRSDRPRALAEWPTMLDIDKAHYYQLTDAALAAVAPAIKAAALEKAAVVAEGISYHGRYRTWPWWANPDGSQGNRENESDVVRHADKIASAIRALKETRP